MDEIPDRIWIFLYGSLTVFMLVWLLIIPVEWSYAVNDVEVLPELLDHYFHHGSLVGRSGPYIKPSLMIFANCFPEINKDFKEACQIPNLVIE